QLFARLTCPDDSLPADLCQHLQAVTGTADPPAIRRSFAHAGQALRHPHHLWLRALASFPQTTQAARHDHLALQAQWQVGQHHPHHPWLRALVSSPETMQDARHDYLALQAQWQVGEDHPWPLIDAYRAWLLHDSGQNAAASACLLRAVQHCAAEENGPVLQWMAEVLRTLGAALGIASPATPSAEVRADLSSQLPGAPHAALERVAHAGRLERPAILAALRDCLPFNFH